MELYDLKGYEELEEIAREWKGKVCLFGAGLIGQTWGYDVINAAGFNIDCYCDNNIFAGQITKNSVRCISLDELYLLGKSVLVFITVSEKYQEELRLQLIHKGITNIIRVDHLFMQKIAESILESHNNEIIEKYKCIVDDAEYLKKQFKFKVGYELRLEEPKTFNEKIQWLKLHDHNSKYIQLVDKYEAKQFIRERIGDRHINPTLGIWNSFDEIEFGGLPNQFVLKCTHDSGSVMICRDKQKLNKKVAKDKFDIKQRYNFYWTGREWPYKNIKGRIIAEKYLENKVGGMIDYKFLCSDGKVKYIFTCSNRGTKTGLCVNFYERDWTPLPFERHYPKRNEEIEKPKQLEEMISLAEELSRDLKFVRIDFYLVDGNIYFSEFTFYPGGGMEEFTPLEWDYRLGEMIKI